MYNLELHLKLRLEISNPNNIKIDSATFDGIDIFTIGKEPLFVPSSYNSINITEYENDIVQIDIDSLIDENDILKSKIYIGEIPSRYIISRIKFDIHPDIEIKEILMIDGTWSTDDGDSHAMITSSKSYLDILDQDVW